MGSPSQSRNPTVRQFFSGEKFSKLPIALSKGAVIVGLSTGFMKAFLQHDQNGLFYQEGGQWVANPRQALAFPSVADAEEFRQHRGVNPSHTVSRIDPALLARFTARAPGAYQMGE